MSPGLRLNRKCSCCVLLKGSGILPACPLRRCTNNQDAWMSGWCYERVGGLLEPGASVSSSETTSLVDGAFAYVTAFR